jgi:hypothetical protein
MISDIDIHVLYPESFNDMVEGVTERECYKGENPSSIECPLENAPSRLIYRSKEHIKCIKNK